MCEIKYEAHIQCKVVSDASIVPGVSAMIREPQPGEFLRKSATAYPTTVSIDGVSYRQIKFKADFLPKQLYFHGVLSKTGKSGNYTTNTKYCVSYSMNGAGGQRLVYAYGYHRQASSTPTLTFSENTNPEGLLTYEEGYVILRIPSSKAGVSYINTDMLVNCYAYG